MSDGSRPANESADDTGSNEDNGVGGNEDNGAGSNDKIWRFQWPVTRTPMIPAYDAALDKWLGDLADGGNSDTRLAADAFKHQINLADHRRNQWEARYYNLRSTVIILAAALTALASASTGISGTGDLAIKIVTAILSFFIAVITGLLELQRASNRWALYRILRNDLFQAVWNLQQSPDYAASQKEKTAQKLGQELSQAVKDFEQQYLLQVVVSDGVSGPKSVKTK